MRLPPLRQVINFIDSTAYYPLPPTFINIGSKVVSLLLAPVITVRSVFPSTANS